MARTAVKTAYLGLGANLGECRKTIARALSLLSETAGISVLQVAGMIETDPVGGPENQPRYINTACSVETTLQAQELLSVCLQIEKALGRDRSPSAVRWGPRVIDIDLLLYDNAVLDEKNLQVPHPRMHERGFVLQPLDEIAEGVYHPVLNQTVRQLLNEWQRAHSGCCESCIE